MRKINIKSIILFVILLNLIYIPIYSSSLNTDITIGSFNDIENIDSISYSVSQTLTHYNEGQFNGGGNIDISFDHSVQDAIFLTIDYDLNIWRIPCDNAFEIIDSVYLKIEKQTRKILSNPDALPGLPNIKDYYTHWFLNEKFNGKSDNPFFYEDLMELQGQLYETQFYMIGERDIFINNERIECYQVSWVGQLLYAGYICNLGKYPYFNNSVDYYYEKNTGVLIYSETNIHQYIYDQPERFQDQKMIKYITALNGDSVDFEDTISGDGNKPIDWPWEGDDRNKFIAIASISGIILIGIISMIIINKRSKKWRVKALMEHEKMNSDKKEQQ